MHSARRAFVHVLTSRFFFVFDFHSDPSFPFPFPRLPAKEKLAKLLVGRGRSPCLNQGGKSLGATVFNYLPFSWGEARGRKGDKKHLQKRGREVEG